MNLSCNHMARLLRREAYGSLSGWYGAGNGFFVAPTLCGCTFGSTIALVGTSHTVTGTTPVGVL